jgi:hypothetical protein
MQIHFWLWPGIVNEGPASEEFIDEHGRALTFSNNADGLICEILP